MNKITLNDLYNMGDVLAGKIEEVREEIPDVPSSYQELVDDVRDLKSAVEHLTDNLINETTEASNPLVITDGADSLPVKDSTVNIQPNQPNQYDSVWVGGAGKNKLPFDLANMKLYNSEGTWNGNVYVRDGVTFTVNDDGSVKISGTATAAIDVAYSVQYLTDPSQFNGMVLNGCTGGSSNTYFLRITDITVASITDYGSGATISGLTNTGKYRAIIRVANGATVNATVYPMIRASGTDPTYEPYSNICPISGWTEADIHRCGVNQWDEVYEEGGISAYNGGNITSEGNGRSKNYIPVVPNTEYYFKTPVTLGLRLYDANKQFVTDKSLTSSGSYTIPSNCHYLRFVAVGITTYANNISINYPSTDTAYHAYEGTTYSVDLSSAGTVYGGTLDVTTGLLTVTKARIDLNGSSSENWQEYSIAQGELHRIINVPRKDGTIPQVSVISDCYRTVSTNESRSENTISGTGTLVDIIDSDYATLTEWKAHIAESPIELVYELATPQTYQLTPTEVTTLLKNNTLTANCGTVSLSYYADTKTYIDNAIATAVASL